jgi:cytochrome o ubiquinol oxidase subunit 1
MEHYDDMSWRPWLIAAFCGACLILLGIILIAVQLLVSIRNRRELRDLTGDPWNGRSLEWALPSPPPPWNFSLLPEIEALDPWWEAKRLHGGEMPAVHAPAGRDHHEAGLRYGAHDELHMPRNTAMGIFVALFAILFGFAMIWHIWWLGLIGLALMIGSMVKRAWVLDTEWVVTDAHVLAWERSHEARHSIATATFGGRA